MVRYRKPVERSEDIIDLRGLTPEQARGVVAARDRARQMFNKSTGNKAILRQQQEEFRRQREKELRAAVLRRQVRRG